MAQASPPRYSADGRWWWDGARWNPVAELQPVRQPPIWLAAGAALIVYLVAAGAVVGLLGIVGAFRAGVAGQNAPGPRNLQVCSLSSVDQNSGICRANQARTPFQTDVVFCSADLVGTAGQTVTGALAYRGQTIRSDSAQLKTGPTSVSFAFAIAPNKLLPGGAWSCRFSLAGQTQSVSFTMRGPTSNFLYQAACDATQVVSPSGIAMCGQDQGVITQSNAIACTALLVGDQGKDAQLDVVYSGGQVAAFTKTYPLTPNNELFPASKQVPASELGNSGSIPAGSYACRWSVDGQQVGEKDFQVK